MNLYNILSPEHVPHSAARTADQKRNSLPTTANSLKKQKNMYEVLTPNPLYKFLWAYGSPTGSFGCYGVQWLIAAGVPLVR